MTRRLIVMRHATAVSGAGLPTDHERPLTPQGTAEAQAVARALHGLGWLPRVALVSDAARTSETWWCMSETLGSPPVEYQAGLYGAGLEALVAAVQRVDPDVDCALVLGHNPGFSDAVDWLCGEWIRLAPAQAALLEADGDRWADVLGRGALALRHLVAPPLSV